MSDNSTPDMSGIDPALIQDFISESQEILDGLDPLFVALEANPDDLSIVDGIFRPVHSVKGNSGFFNLTNIKNFAHVMENILGEIRARKRTATPPLVDLLLKGVDFLRSMMNRLAQNDFSGKFTPEEEAHLALLNEASAAGGDGGARSQTHPDTPEAGAAKVLEAFGKVKSGAGNSQLLDELEHAIQSFIRVAVPEFHGNTGEGGSVSVGYRIASAEVTGAVNTIWHFLANLERNEKEEALCEAFLTALEAINEAGRQKEPEIPALVNQIKDDFLTIHDSGIGFDELMASLIKERFDSILKHVERYEVGGDGDFFANGENVTDLVKSMHEFVGDIQLREKETVSVEQFLNAMIAIRDMAGKNCALLQAVERMQDDFITIHESGIGFDDLMQSLLSDRLTTVLSYLERGAAAQASYFMGENDVTAVIERLLKAAGKPAGAVKSPEAIEKLARDLQSFAEIAETAGKAELGVEAVSLVSDLGKLQASDVGFDENMKKMIAGRLAKLAASTEKRTAEAAPPERKAEERAAPPPPDNAGAEAQKEQRPSSSPTGKSGHQEPSGKTLRVAEEKVDHFMSFVGELIITGEVFAYIQKKLEQYPEVRQVAQEFKNANLSFAELSSNLQKSLMEVRRVPLKSVLQKLHRIVRDTAGQLGKKIDFEIAGEDVQIDKSLLEGLESPLVHMVRNSVDHGVEIPEDRVAAGKEETGHVWINASATEEQFTLSIKDDGKGLDLDAIKSKAVSRGLISEDAARNMSDKDAFRLVFNAGLSTAKVVTDVSGRGVGMDVVLSNITKMNGNIMVDSTYGQGSVFTILLPMTVTLTVIDGLVARIGDQFYIIPLSDVRESVRPERGQVHVIKGEREILNVRGELHPIVRLNQVLGIYSGNVTENVYDATAVLVQGKRGASAAFLVDELIGQQSVVVKDLGKEFEHIRSLSGASILGDGRVGLVLSVLGVLGDVGLEQGKD